MKTNRILSILSICILGAGLLTCAVESIADIQFFNGTSGKTGTSGKAAPGTIATPSSQQSVVIKEVFDQVVQVLHTPYSKGDFFFRHVTSTAAINDSKTDSGSGTWSVTAAANTAATENQDIIYEYKAYQPTGSDLIVTGKMEAMYRKKGTPKTTKNTAIADSIIFNKTASDIYTALQRGSEDINALGNNPSAEVKAAFNTLTTNSTAYNKVYANYTANTAQAEGEDAAYAIVLDAYTLYIKAFQALINAAKATGGIGQHIDTLQITGAHQATLTFIYKYYAIQDLSISSEDYKKFLIDKLFTAANAEIQFTYADETITLNKEQIEQLLYITK